jgi:uncharacterized protein (TIGR00251 family)
VTIRVKVVPASSRSEVTGEMADGTLKVNVAAPADKGKANEELCRVLAAHYGVARRAVSIVSGHASPRKLVRVGEPETRR